MRKSDAKRLILLLSHDAPGPNCESQISARKAVAALLWPEPIRGISLAGKLGRT
jgi:hypothetical protein